MDAAKDLVKVEVLASFYTSLPALSCPYLSMMSNMLASSQISGLRMGGSKSQGPEKEMRAEETKIKASLLDLHISLVESHTMEIIPSENMLKLSEHQRRYAQEVV